ncbi:MAG: SAM hydroxide adenosyltransferase [Candidatus Paceibacterota bacterium]
MFITAITDCQDDNAINRMMTRALSLLDTGTFSGVTRLTSGLNRRAELEAAGNLVDILDASEGRPGIVMGNVAPRNGDAHDRWDNGTPFGYFRYRETLVVTTIDGAMLSLVKKLGIVDTINSIDMEKVVTDELDHTTISYAPGKILGSQFRSFDFLPRVAVHLYQHGDVTSIPKSLEGVPDVNNVIWWIDSFGNCKTTLTPEDIQHRPDEPIETEFGPIGYRYSLKSVPDGETALIVGSSGFKETRFLEIATQGGNAAKEISANVGDSVLL